MSCDLLYFEISFYFNKVHIWSLVSQISGFLQQNVILLGSKLLFKTAMRPLYYQMVLHAGHCSSCQSQYSLHVLTLCFMRCTVRPLDVTLCFKTTNQHKPAHLSQLLVDLIYSKPTEKTSVNIFPLETIIFICAIWARQHIFSSFSFLLSKEWHSLVQFLGQGVNSDSC